MIFVGDVRSLPLLGALHASLELHHVTRDALRAILREGRPAVRVEGVPKARLLADVRAAEWLARGEGGQTAGDLRSAAERHAGTGGVDPSDVLDLDPSYEVSTTWSGAGADRFDLIARHRARGPKAVVVAPAPGTQ